MTGCPRYGPTPARPNLSRFVRPARGHSQSAARSPCQCGSRGQTVRDEPGSEALLAYLTGPGFTMSGFQASISWPVSERCSCTARRRLEPGAHCGLAMLAGGHGHGHGTTSSCQGHGHGHGRLNQASSLCQRVTEVSTVTGPDRYLES